jgi:hypothetical protein
MKGYALSASLLATLLMTTSAVADDDKRMENRHENRTTIAVFGDWPYNKLLFDNAPLLIDSVNSDPDVSLVLHVGDIHSGSMACTSAGVLPPIPTSNPGWNQSIFAQFQKFKWPTVYTPGDNEWTDCHKAKQLKSGDPLKELTSVRSLFFSRPGWTLGLNQMQVYSQAQRFDRNFSTDAQYVENVIWQDAKTVFVTVNMPGSNNDGLPWTDFENATARNAEREARTAADIRWLQTAFSYAIFEHAAAVVIGLQADMWDPAAVNGDGLNNYTLFVQELAVQSRRFGRPVLLINGDSHVFGADHPLADPASTTGQIHHALPTPNLTRITVQGSTNKPAEWLKLTIDSRTASVFSWSNVPYCADPTATSCN